MNVKPRADDIGFEPMDVDPAADDDPEGIAGASDDGFDDPSASDASAGDVSIGSGSNVEEADENDKSSLTQEEAQEQGTELREAPKTDKFSLPDIDTRYVDRDQAKEGPLVPGATANLQGLMADLKDASVNNALQDKWRSGEILTQGSESNLLWTAYHQDSMTLVILLADKAGNTAEEDDRLTTSELTYQWLRDIRGLTDEDSGEIGVRYVAQNDITNTDTTAFIRSAVAELEPGATYLKIEPGTSAAFQKWFDTLLGSDNGRPTQWMLIDHPTHFGETTVVAIHVWPSATVNPTNHAGNPMMILEIGGGYLAGL